MREEKLREVIREEIGALLSVSGDDRLLDDKQVAAILGMNHRTLQNWRTKGLGPDYIQVSGNRPRYLMSSIAKFIADRTVKGRAV